MTSPIADAARFERAIRLIDQANAMDPRTENWEGSAHPKELLYAQRMSDWLERLELAASEELRLAVRAQHLQRWESPRGNYPMGRTGYLLWRKDLYKFHAAKAAEILREVGYEDSLVERVSELIQKKNLQTDKEAATLEDVACLVFLEFYFADFAPDHDEEKVIHILRRTWKKMSERGREAALTIKLCDRAKVLLERALAGA